MEHAEGSDNDKLPVGWKICPKRSPSENTMLAFSISQLPKDLWKYCSDLKSGICSPIVVL